jgi:hypothetical protein
LGVGRDARIVIPGKLLQPDEHPGEQPVGIIGPLMIVGAGVTAEECSTKIRRQCNFIRKCILMFGY